MGGVDFSFVSLKTIRADDAVHPEEGDPGEAVDWRNVATYTELADAIDARAKILFPDSADVAQSEDTRFGVDSQRDLAQTLQALYDSEINVTITRRWPKPVDDRYVYTGLDF